MSNNVNLVISFIYCRLIISIENTFIDEELSNDTLIFDADVDALNDTPIAQSFAEARVLGPIVTPRQYRCSFCNTGMCGVVVNTIQCFCGNTQCPPSTTGMNRDIHL